MDAVSDDRMLRLTRVFDAPIERVFSAWTDEKQFAQWFGPGSMKVVACKFDAVAGGAWRVQSDDDGTPRAVSGKYLEIVPPRRLVFTWAPHPKGTLDTPRAAETTVTIEFRAVGGKTEMILTQGPFLDRAELGKHDRGWVGAVAKLAAFLSRTA